MPGYMKYSFALATLLSVQTISTKVENQMVLFQPGISFEQIDRGLQQAIQIEDNHLQEEMRREAEFLKFDQQCHAFFKKVYPAGLLLLMYHEQPAKGAALALAYLFQVL